jgi:hypothetical protein
MEYQKLHQFFKYYHQKQTSSLNGYFHISSTLSFEALIQLPAVSEWLNSYQYYARIHPSQSKEMVKIGALCYISTLTFRKHLKQAIMTHTLWEKNHEFADSQIIFDLFISDFLSPGKRTKMLFISARKSRQDKASTLFKQIYHGTRKSYPNGYIMLYIPILEIVNSSPDIRAKIAFNHKKYTGEEALSSICGLNDLNTPLKLKNGKTVMIRTLLQSIPATEGMSRPQLFQTVEAKFTTLATIVTCQASDQKLVYQ